MTRWRPRVVRYAPPGGTMSPARAKTTACALQRGKKEAGGEGWIRTNVDGVANRSISPLCHFALAPFSATLVKQARLAHPPTRPGAPKRANGKEPAPVLEQRDAGEGRPRWWKAIRRIFRHPYCASR